MNQLVNAISNRIYDTFGIDYDIHLESVTQDFKTPAFCIVLMPTKADPYIMGVERNDYAFDILYYPEHEHYRQELIEMGAKLNDAFRKPLEVDESLNTMQTIPVTDRVWRIVDDVLHFTFRLDFYMDTYDESSGESSGELMDDMKQIIEID